MSVLQQVRNRILVPVAERAYRKVCNLVVESRNVEPRINYPSYKSFDEFLDLPRLTSLNGYLKEKIEQRLKTQDELFHTGVLTVKGSSPQRPGSQIIYLSKAKGAFQYFDLDKPGLWSRTEDAAEFELLMDFVATLPFEQTARMMIMYDRSGGAVTAHRDHAKADVCHEFIWFRTNLDKPFYLLNSKTEERRYVESYSAWFDTVNQLHGADAYPGLSLSIRVDGRFTDEFRKRIPVPAYNLASTPSFWAGTSPLAG